MTPTQSAATVHAVLSPAPGVAAKDAESKRLASEVADLRRQVLEMKQQQQQQRQQRQQRGSAAGQPGTFHGNCYACGTFGHRAVDCRSRTPAPGGTSGAAAKTGTGRQQPPSVHQIMAGGLEVGTDLRVIGQTESGCSLVIGLDTLAQVSLVGAEVAKACGHGWTQPAIHKVTGVGGGARPLGQVTMPLVLGTGGSAIHIKVICLVMQSLSGLDLLLSKDTIQRLGTTVLDWDANQCRLGDCCMPLIPSEMAWESSEVVPHAAAAEVVPLVHRVAMSTAAAEQPGASQSVASGVQRCQ